MPKRTRSTGRVRGYHYAKRRDGTRYRVYTTGRTVKKTAKGSAAPRAAPRKYTKKSYPASHSGRKDYFGDTIMGVGAYRQRKGKGGSAVILGGNPPTVQNTASGFIIRHREFIGDLLTSQAFTNTPFDLNPGNPACFPWMANVAANFEEWVPRGIVFEFKSTSSDAVVSTNANAALGTVIMATEYNPYNGAFGNKQQMENYEWAKSCKPSQSMLHGVECSKNQNPMGSYFIRTQAVPSNQDKRLYDLGLFQIASVGMQSSGAACGELWVSYEIELRKPRIQVGIAGEPDATTNFDHIAIYNATLATAGVLPATPFGTSTTVPIYPSTQSTLGGVVSPGAVTAASFAAQPNSPTKNNFLGGIPVLAGGLPTGALGNGSANTYYWPPGQTTGNFMVTYLAKWGVTGVPANPTVVLSNCSALNLISTDTLNQLNNDSSANTTTTCTTFFVSITRGNASFSMTGTAGATTPTYAELFVTQIPNPVN